MLGTEEGPPKEVQPNPEGSITATFTPIITALVEGEELLGPNRTWQPSNDSQAEFLRRYFSRREEFEAFLKERSSDDPLTINSIASFSADEINQFLQNHGISIRLDEFQKPNLGVASVMEVLVKWVQEGSSTTLKAENGKQYDAVRLKNQVSIQERPGNPIVVIGTKDPNYTVSMAIPSRPIKDGFDLLNFIDVTKRSHVARAPSSNYEGVIFPKVDLDQMPDISWLQGINTLGDDGLPAIVDQALQQTIFKMNEKGAYAKSVVTMVMTRGYPPMPKPPYIIDRPFACWIERKGLSTPVFAGYINYADWKNPGELPTPHTTPTGSP